MSDREGRKLTYWIDGEEYEGTLQDYATALQHEALDGVQVGIVVRTDKGKLKQPQRKFSGYNVDDLGYTTSNPLGVRRSWVCSRRKGLTGKAIADRRVPTKTKRNRGTSK